MDEWRCDGEAQFSMTLKGHAWGAAFMKSPLYSE